MRIAVLSDTHGLLRPEVMEIVNTCDAVLHGGDINTQRIVDELQKINLSTLSEEIMTKNGRNRYRYPFGLSWTVLPSIWCITKKKSPKSDRCGCGRIRSFPQISGGTKGRTSLPQSGELRKTPL